ncbi:VOC family protein [Micromonosporaceae bacterium Da 78-11]
MTPTFDAMGTAVADMTATLDFYRLLGMDIPPEANDAPHVDVPLAGGFRLMFDTYETVQSIDPDFVPPAKGGEPGGSHFSLGFRCAGPAEVDSTYRLMVDAGHRGQKEPWDAFWGQRYAVLLDPDGHQIDLYAELT